MPLVGGAGHIISGPTTVIIDEDIKEQPLEILQSMNARNNKDYPQAKQYGRGALILTLINIIFTMFLVILTVGLSVGFACANPSNYAYYYSYYGK